MRLKTLQLFYRIIILSLLLYLFAAKTMTGSGHTVEALPVKQVLEMMMR